MDDIQRARRRFIKAGFALASLPIAGSRLTLGQTGQSDVPKRDANDKLMAYGEPSRFVTSERIVEIPGSGGSHHDPFGLTNHLLTPLQDSVGIITPASLHYVAAHAGFYVPDINPAEHRLMIHGMVDHPMLFTMEELKRFPSMSRIHYLECNANFPKARDKTVQEAAGRTSCNEWTGVPLSLLLNEAGVQNGANWIVAEGAEENKGTYCIPLARAMDEYCLVAYGQNGEAIRPQNGFPLRLLVPGLEAINSVKWLRRITVTSEFYMTYNNMGRYSSIDPNIVKTDYVQGPKSVITFPSGGQKLPSPGHYEITGLAWSGAGAVRKVEISVDGGKTWKEAQIRSAVHRIAHTRFGMSWNWTGEEHVLMSRCTDEKGQLQPTPAEFNSRWKPESRGEAHPNFILPWKLGRDGMVQNGLS